MEVCRRIMLILFILWIKVTTFVCGRNPTRNQCVTGYMTDVQSWVDKNGMLTNHVDKTYSLDLSWNAYPTPLLRYHIKNNVRNEKHYIKYLSMASCELRRVPKVFNMRQDDDNRTLANTLVYLTFYGNIFKEVSSAGVEYDVELNATDFVEESLGISLRNEVSIMWFNGFQGVEFDNLKELDLRACGIESLKPLQFKNMPELEALYLGQNIIHTIEANSFGGLPKLLHLDLSLNSASDSNGNSKLMLIESADVFQVLGSLKSLDFSHTQLNQRNIAAFRVLGKSLERLSVCFVGPMKLTDRFFKETSLKILDISGSINILSTHLVLSGLESTLEVLYANDIGLINFDIFENFKKLEVLSLSRNEITTIRKKTAQSLVKLQMLDLSKNRIGSWLTPVYRYMKSLKMLNLLNNNINVISEEMMEDLTNITYLGLSENSLVCNCRSKDLVELASKNELKIKPAILKSSSEEEEDRFNYHRAFSDIHTDISLRRNISYICAEGRCEEPSYNGSVLLMDYNVMTYSCYNDEEGLSVPVTKVTGCEKGGKTKDLLENLDSGWNKFFLLCIPGVVLPLLFLAFTFRRNLRYFCVTMRNSALISMVNKNRIIDDDTIFNYEVFVSYCNEDRPWVLDQLLSHLEMDCSVSLCLHERDFQVGLSILENIVSCMDRSKFIMLVISQQFLLSQWCQFEMHLAQHRLLETRREDLILILLEDIPRRLRPNTLHYLMLTKTYIVWPKNKSEQNLFWKRLKKTIVSRKLKQQATVSLA